MTSIELFLHAQFYRKHPSLVSCFTTDKECFSCLESVLKVSVSDLKFEKLVQHEAINNCHEGQWSSFLCILALSSVVGRKIHILYPDFGLEKYKLLFNTIVHPRQLPHSDEKIFILFCCEGRQSQTGSFKPNHFVPLVSSGRGKFQAKIGKNKLSVSSSSLQQPLKKTKKISSGFSFQSRLPFFLKRAKSVSLPTNTISCSSLKNYLVSNMSPSHSNTIYLPTELMKDKL